MSKKNKKKEQENLEPVYHKKLIKRRKPNRSIVGDIFLYLFLLLVALVMAFPLIYAVSSALKPLDELFKFPPKILPQNPTFDNFSDLFVTMGKSWVTFSRYLFNTVFITFVGTFGHLIVASMGAFVLAKYDFPGNQAFFKLVTVAMMFTGYVTQIPNYLILNKLGWIDSYWAIIIPGFASPMGLFLMKQFMEGLPTSLIEAANAERETRLADAHHLLSAGAVEQQGCHIYLLRGKEDTRICHAADSEWRYCKNGAGCSGAGCPDDRPHCDLYLL